MENQTESKTETPMGELNLPDILPKKPHLTFPKIPPYKAVQDYRISKNFTKMEKMYPEFDVVRQKDPSSNLALLQIKLQETDKALRHKRKSLIVQRHELDKQWKELDDKEKSLRENFELFDVFVRENMEKRERAAKKVKEETIQIEQRDLLIKKLTGKYDEFKVAKSQMDEKIRQYRLYEDFLNNVVEQSNFTFLIIQDLIDRYLSLLDAKQSLAEQQEDNLTALENARSDMMKLVEEKTLIIMGLTNQIASLQARYEHANIKSLESEELVIQIKNHAVKKMNEVDEVLNSVYNMYIHMVQFKKQPVKLKKHQVEEQMIYIKRTLTELGKINQLLKKKMKGLGGKQGKC